MDEDIIYDPYGKPWRNKKTGKFLGDYEYMNGIPNASDIMSEESLVLNTYRDENYYNQSKTETNEPKN